MWRKHIHPSLYGPNGDAPSFQAQGCDVEINIYPLYGGNFCCDGGWPDNWTDSVYANGPNDAFEPIRRKLAAELSRQIAELQAKLAWVEALPSPEADHVD